MVDHQVEYLWSLIFFLVSLFNVVQKSICNFLARRKAYSDLATKDVVGNGCNLEETSIVEDAKMVHDQGKGNLKKVRKRPAMIVIPESCVATGFGEFGEENKAEEKDLEVEGSGYCLASRKGKRHGTMEDGYGVITDINGDSKQVY